MAVPGSSDGQEVLRRGFMHAQSNDATSFKWDGTHPTVGIETDTVPAHHIITVLSIVFTDQSNGAEEIIMSILRGSNNHYIIYRQAIAAYGTFIWEEKIVLHAADIMWVTYQAATNQDIWYSYLDQDWS
jgi:hypothetical protein